MRLFVDSSALIANEADAYSLAERLGYIRHRLCSPLALWETVSGLRRSYGFEIDAARTIVDRFMKDMELTFVPIGEREYVLVLEAYERYGKGRHPAALNMGDCFAYACAKANEATLLYKDNDFSRTDLA